MDKYSNDLIYKLLGQLTETDKAVPNAIQSFASLSNAALEEGVINTRIKHMIALTVAIVGNFHSCVDFHLQNLIKQKLKYEELLELCTIAVYMGGGPAFSCMTETLTRFQHMQPVADIALDLKSKSEKKAKKSVRISNGIEIN